MTALLKQKAPGKYTPNAFGLYDCPEAGCDRKADHGLKNPQSVGAHLLHTHGRSANGNHVKMTTPRRRTVPTTAPLRIDVKDGTIGLSHLEMGLALHIAMAPQYRQLPNESLQRVFGAISTARAEFVAGAAI